MTPCAECMFDWEISESDTCGVIAGFGDAYRDRLARFMHSADASVIRRRPSPKVWSALEYAAHVRDVIAFYSERVDEVIHQERPRMQSADFASMPAARRYLDDDPVAVLDAISASSTSVATVLRSLSPEQWGRIGVGSSGDERTTLILARRLAHDGQHHLLDLDRLAEALLPAIDPTIE